MFIHIKNIIGFGLGLGICVLMASCQRTDYVSRTASTPSMRAVLNKHLGASTQFSLPLRPSADIREHRYQNNAHQSLAQSSSQARFPRLDNPNLIMWIHPHLRGEVSVPGYAVAFPMYRRIHARLPNEQAH